MSFLTQLLASVIRRKTERRRALRFSYVGEAEVIIDMWTTEEARIHDISEGGISLTLRRPLARNSRIEVCLEHPTSPLKLVGLVVHRSTQGEDIIGVRWEGMSADERLRLSELLDSTNPRVLAPEES